MVLSLADSLEVITNFITDSVSAILSFIKLLFDLPGLFITMFATFPSFIRVGFIVIFAMLVIVVVIRIKSYLL